MIDKKAPIIVGVGQTVEQVPSDLAQCSSHADMAAEAARKAIEDALDDSLLSEVDTLVCVRTFVDSGPSFGREFGKPANFPRAVAKRLGINAEHAVYEIVGGQSPQKLVGEFSEKLNSGDHDVVLLAGGDVIANMKAATQSNTPLDWHEDDQGQVEDRGLSNGHHTFSAPELQHKIMLPMQFYALMEQARRGASKMDLDSYCQQMSIRFSAFSKVAKTNPYSMFASSFEPSELSTVSDKNPMLQSPYPKNIIAKDSVNMGAALILTTVGKARELGIAPEKWVFLHGYTTTKEKLLLERENLAKSNAMEAALTGCLDANDKAADDIDYFDLYSCFPIVVSEACNILGISDDDPRPLTQTGGLPFFGAPGNNYSTHAIAAMVETLRANPSRYGMVYANGGWMSKHAAGVYSTQPPQGTWQAFDSTSLQAKLDAGRACEISLYPEGEAVLESYTINTAKGQAINSIVIGRLKDSGKRFYASNAFNDKDTLAATLAGDKMGQTIFVTAEPKGNRYAYSKEKLEAFTKSVVTTFQQSYEFCIVEKHERVLIVTINRPDTRNAFHPQLNQEMENIFNAFEADSGLWVAIVTGAGDKAFSAGNDLKYQARGGEVWVPKTGFGGLTARQNRSKPVIAALNGLAVGGGLEVALATDMIVAADHALLGLPEVKVGLYAAAGGIQRLTRMIGTKKAVEMIVTGDLIDAPTALQHGLVNYVVPADQVMSKALELAEKIVSVSPTAVSTSLKVIHESSHYSNVDDAVTYESRLVDNLLNCGDFIEGPTAFAEKRKPKWEDPSA